MRHSTATWIAASALAFSIGCRTVSHKQATEQAEQRWGQVRGRVKLQLARQQSESGLFEDSIATLTESIALDPSCGEAYVLLARANLELGKTASAQQAVEAAMQRGLSSADLYYTRGVIREQQEAYPTALEDYAKSLEMNPRSVDSLVARVECLVTLDRIAEAGELLERSLHRFDDSATVAVLAARVAELAGDESQTVRLWRRASLAAADDPGVAEELGVRLARAGRCAEALAQLDPVAVAKSGCGAARRATARCLLESGDARQARAVLTEYVEAHPTDATAQLLFAQVCLETGDPWNAARALGLAREHRGDDSEVRLTQAALYWRRAELPTAAEELYTLLERDPGFGPAYSLLAEILAAQGQPDAAADCRERASLADSGSR